MVLNEEMDLNDIQIFCKAAENRNFTETSILLGVTPSAVSKAISRLEKKLNIKLFHRSTRSMRLTEEGKGYYSVCKEAVENIRNIERQISNNSDPRGVLRISMPDSYGIKRCLPLINDFLEKYSAQIHLEISLSNSYVNFNKDEFDLAIRIGDVKDDRLVAKKFDAVQPMLVASPTYLKRHGMPKEVSDLHHHQCIGLRFLNAGQLIPWEFSEAVDPFHLVPCMIHSNSLGALETVLNGFGIMQFFDYAVEPEIDQQRLIELFPQYRPEKKPVYLVYPSGRYISAKVRLFMDYLLSCFKEI